jgi:hypothetical protein
MRCGFWYQRRELINQMRWRGAALLPTWVFVCRTCNDTPNEQERAVVWPADPVPVQLALPEDFSVANSVMGLALPQQETVLMGLVDLVTYMTTTDGDYMAEANPEVFSQVDPITGIPLSPGVGMQTVDGVVMAPTPTGRPPGYDALVNQPVATNDVVIFMSTTKGAGMQSTDGTNMGTEEDGFDGAPGDAGLPSGTPISIVSLMADGTPLVRATCNRPHGLTLNSQIFVRGTGNPLADGAFSVIPITATAFTYGTYSPIPAGSLLEPGTLMVATQIGLPRDFPALPQTGLPAAQARVSKGVQ